MASWQRETHLQIAKDFVRGARRPEREMKIGVDGRQQLQGGGFKVKRGAWRGKKHDINGIAPG
jgi:hypothetical protein